MLISQLDRACIPLSVAFMCCPFSARRANLELVLVQMSACACRGVGGAQDGAGVCLFIRTLHASLWGWEEWGGGVSA